MNSIWSFFDNTECLNLILYNIITLWEQCIEKKLSYVMLTSWWRHSTESRMFLFCSAYYLISFLQTCPIKKSAAFCSRSLFILCFCYIRKGSAKKFYLLTKWWSSPNRSDKILGMIENAETRKLRKFFSEVSPFRVFDPVTYPDRKHGNFGKFLT